MVFCDVFIILAAPGEHEASMAPDHWTPMANGHGSFVTLARNQTVFKMKRQRETN